MAKAYVGITKYMITAEFEVNGIVDKPDIVGAVFGQSEGLLGEEMDLKELQKSGKIGRIEVDQKTTEGKTTGTLAIPSSMDVAETSLLAAAIESVEKVGPCSSAFKVTEISDVRTNKRDKIKERAKELLQRLKIEQLPEGSKLAEELRENTRTADIKGYGPEKLPCGPEIDSAEEIIVVEGRADVLNLLRNNIKNVIGMEGAKIPQTIVELSKRKALTAFVDGDRGGELNARKLQQIASVQFVARAPDGKEVEELTGKEIIQALKRKMPATDTMFTPRTMSYEEPYRPRRPSYRERSYTPRTGLGRGTGISRYSSGRGRPTGRGRYSSRGPPRRESSGRYGRIYEATEFSRPVETASPEEKQKFSPILEEIKKTEGTELKAKLFNKDMKELKEVAVKNLLGALDKIKEVKTIVFDGIITKRLVDAAEKHGIETVVGVRTRKIEEEKKVKAITVKPEEQ